MRYDIVAGEELRKIMSGTLDDPIPFNEDMSKGAYSSKPFSDGFIRERSQVHGVSESTYRDKLSLFLSMLENIKQEDEVHLHFGEDEVCFSNRRFLIGYLSDKVSSITLHIVDEYTGEEIKEPVVV